MPTDGAPLPTKAFEISYTGRCVDLLLHPRAPGDPPETLQAVVAALQSSPLPSVDNTVVARALSAHSRASDAPARVEVGQAAIQEYDRAPCAIVVSLDRLAAYAVPVAPPPAASPPPAEEPPVASATGEADAVTVAAGGDPPLEAPVPAAPLLLTAAELRSRLAAAGVVGGLLDDVIDGFGDGAELTDIRCVARGQLPTPGTDAELQYHIDSGEPGAPTPAGHGGVDFHALAVHRFVSEKAVLVTRHPRTPGVAGYDVRGTAIEPPPALDIDLRRFAGVNTAVDGETLVATTVGRPVLGPRGTVEVLPVFEVAGNVDYSVGNIEFPGDVIVRGDVKAGFSIVAGGSVTVGGLVEGASITAAGDLSVMGAVGERRTVFDVGGDLHARYLHTTEARVAGEVSVVGEILDCVITAERVSTSSRGRIVAGRIEARAEVDTGMLGSRDGNVTEVRVTSESPEAVIRARGTVQPGLVVTIGDASLRIDDEISGASFWNVGGMIGALKSMADQAAADAVRYARGVRTPEQESDAPDSDQPTS